MRKVCKCCVNDSTVKNIKFNKEGLCNFCQTYQKEYDIWHDFAKLEKIFDEKISTIKKERQEGKYQYDVCIPFSGGKDSTYVLYQMMTKYDLKVKTFTLPANIVEIKTSNFVNILEMEDFYVKGSAVTAIDSNIFNTHSSSLRLWVPFEGLNYYYSATNWAKMNSYMIAEKEIAEGETFPTIDYSLNWYATILDATNNTNILTSPTGAGTYYCKFVIS